MPRKDVLDAMRKYTDPFRVTKGKAWLVFSVMTI